VILCDARSGKIAREDGFEVFTHPRRVSIPLPLRLDAESSRRMPLGIVIRMHVFFGLATNTPGGWREGMAKDGILMEVPSGRIVYPKQMGQLLSIL
jgi:hypothetical protein